MPPLERLDAGDLVAVIAAFRDALRSHQEYINRLNVYPVPDGDTGTNMALTVESVVEELHQKQPESMGEVAAAVAHGSLMGARGNSGVILSQILRGLVAPLTEEPGAGLDAPLLAEGLRRAADGAYQAVQKPVEGTILTVIRESAEGAAHAAGGLSDVVAAAAAAGRAALERTPDLLPVLKAAGVVDSGGTGLLLLFDALARVIDGSPLPQPLDLPDAGATKSLDSAGRPGHAASNPAGPRFEVMYLLEAPDELIPAFREVWAGIGDSIVVVGGDRLWNCHIHTDEIGAAIEAALDAGRPRKIRVTDLFEEVEEESWVRAAAGTPAEGEGPEEEVRCAVVAVCTGEGIRRIFRSLGVHHVVAGGQSMNPSTADLLAAVNACRAEEIVILPNNKNIVPVAEAAAKAAGRPVHVVPTRGIQEGFAALLEYDPEGDAASNAELMGQSAGRVVAGEVTRAVRNSTCDAGPITEGDWLGISRQGIEVVAPGPEISGAATLLLNRLIDPDHHEVVTVIAGEGAGAPDTRRVTEWLAAEHPDIAVEVHQGGQPLYPYLFSVE